MESRGRLLARYCGKAPSWPVVDVLHIRKLRRYRRCHLLYRAQGWYGTPVTLHGIFFVVALAAWWCTKSVVQQSYGAMCLPR